MQLFALDRLMEADSKSLSGGEKQKVAIVRSLLKGKELIILDEPVAALDFSGIIHLKRELKHMKENRIILFISHNEELLDLADEFIELA